jgi:hypothetical protein
VLPPPVQAFKHHGQLVVTVNETWSRLALEKSYYEPIPVPVPAPAVDQNAALLILTSAPMERLPEFTIHHERRQSSFARKVGLSTVRRKARLLAAMERVTDWFMSVGGDLMVLYGPRENLGRGKLMFVGWQPKVPRVKRHR